MNPLGWPPQDEDATPASLLAQLLRGQIQPGQPPQVDPRLLAAQLRGRGQALQQEQAAHDEAMGRQAAFGNLGLLSGDPVLSRFGQQQLNAVTKFDPTSLRSMTLQQGQDRLGLQLMSELRRQKLAEDRFGFDKEKAAAAQRVAAQRADAAAAHAAEPPKGRGLTADVAQQIGDYDTALTAVNKLVDAHKSAGASGFGGLVMGMLGDKTGGLIGGKVKEFNDLALATQQVVGVILEHGKLAAGDELKYKRLQPQAGDSAAVVLNKARGLQTLIASSRTNRLAALRAAGFDTSGFDGAGGSGQASQPSGVDVDLASSAPTVAGPRLPETAKPRLNTTQQADPSEVPDEVAARELSWPTELMRTGETPAQAYARTTQGFEKDFPAYNKITHLYVPDDAERGYVNSHVHEGDIIRIGNAVVQKKNGTIHYLVKPQGFLSAAEKKKLGIR